MKNQIVIIHGGHVYDVKDDFLSRLKERKVAREDFKSKTDWKDDLEVKLASDFEIFAPRMPNRDNAKYVAWKIWFDKLLPYLEDDLTLVGSSLGGLFLVKYLSENIFPKMIRSLILVAAPYNGKDSKHDLETDFSFNDNFKQIDDEVEDVLLFHSTDDKVVPFSDSQIYRDRLSNSALVSLDNRGHFDIDVFPELIEKIKAIYS